MIYAPRTPHDWLVIHHRADDGARVRIAARRDGFEVHWPREIVRMPRRDDVIRPLFPGYMFARSPRTPWGCLLDIDNVITVVGLRQQGRPSLAPDRLVQALIEKAGGINEAIDTTPDAKDMFTKGERVKIVEGLWRGMDAIFEADRGQDRVEVLLGILGVAKAEMPASAIARADGDG